MHYPTIESTIGNTPLVRLQRLPGDTSNTILVKLEGNNPAGSVKDRPALSMLIRAEARGEISPGVLSQGVSSSIPRMPRMTERWIVSESENFTSHLLG